MTQLEDGYYEARVHFLNVELELGITFCQVARVTAELAKAKRNVANARRAFATVKKVSTRVKLKTRDEILLWEKSAQLTALLSELEQSLGINSLT